jgi:hypothetical protein
MTARSPNAAVIDGATKVERLPQLAAMHERGRAARREEGAAYWLPVWALATFLMLVIWGLSWVPLLDLSH